MKWTLISALAFCVLFSPGARAEETKPEIPSITVVASASEEVRPDLAILTLGVETERPDRIAAAEQNARAARAMIDKLKAEGIDPADIKTSAVSLDPIIIEERDPKTRAVIKRTVTGYKASNYIDVRIRNIDRAGAIATEAIASGGNVFRRLSFKVSDEVQREEALRIKAIAEAHRRAKAYAGAASAKLGRLLKIDPASDGPYGNAADLARPPAPDQFTRIVIPVEPGVNQVGALVTVTWELAQD